MDPLAPIRAEYLRYRRLVELAVAQVGDADLDRRLAGDGNSIAITIAHLTGNLRSRFTDFLTTDGEKPWRERDREFEDPGCGREQLLADWRAAWQVVDRALAEVAALPRAALDHRITIRGQPLTVLEALHRSVAHVAYHAGQVVLLARTFAGDAWRSLSIPRSGSAAYAADPTRERGPDASGSSAVDPSRR
jgi:hypothetical protein